MAILLPLGIAHAALGEAATAANVERVEREFFDLFIGIGRGELLPYGSYYLTGFLNERPLARLRDDLARLGIERVEGEVEPEDHAAVLCEIMAGLADGRFDGPAGADRELFEKHLAPWIGRFFADLEHAKAADFYRRIGTVGRVFIEIESEAFALAHDLRECKRRPEMRAGELARTENQGVSAMKTEKKVGRRDFLRALGAGAGVAVTASGPLVQEAAADSESNDEKRKARYKADSAGRSGLLPRQSLSSEVRRPPC